MSLSVLNDENFASEILASRPPAMVDFFSTWCGPCKTLAPIVEKLAKEYAGRLKVGKLNIEDAPLTPVRYGVVKLPTIVFFAGGQAVDTVVGVARERELRDRIERLIGATISPGR